MIKQIKWSKDLVIEKILTLGLGQRNVAYVEKYEKQLCAAGRNHFGSWRAAVEKSGLDYKDVCKYKQWNKVLVIEEILALANSQRNPTYAKKYENQLYKAALGHFFSWQNAIGASGLNYNDTLTNKQWSKALIIEEIQTLESNAMFDSYVAKYKSQLYSSAYRYYGSWRIAVEKAGFNYDDIKNNLPSMEKHLFNMVKDLLPEKTHSQYNK